LRHALDECGSWNRWQRPRSQWKPQRHNVCRRRRLAIRADHRTGRLRCDGGFKPSRTSMSAESGDGRTRCTQLERTPTMPVLWLLAASIAALIQYSAHTYLFLRSGPQGQELGYGLMVILAGLVQATISLLLATHARSRAEILRSLIVVLVVANV